MNALWSSRGLRNSLKSLLKLSCGLMSAEKPPVPIFVVCGATGTGKTKLGVEIAQKVGGEVINADCIQMYRGLDIATNKATAEEMNGVPHHLLAFLDPSVDDFTVHQFQASALALISSLTSANKPPVLVGGTHYYLESILYHFLSSPSSQPASSLPPPPDDIQQLHQHLRAVRPDAASRVHPRDKRKLLSALKHGRAVEEERPRFPDRVVLVWLDSEAKALMKRLDKRVDGMMESGLLGELEEFWKELGREKGEERWKSGIWSAIGMKEFLPWLKEEEEAKRSKLLPACIDRLKISTRQYARHQRKWITNRLLARCPALAVPVFRLDSTEPARWSDTVSQPLHAIIEFWRGRATRGEVEAGPETGLDWWADCPVRPEPVKEPKRIFYGEWRCEACDRTLFTEEEWTTHLKSRRHKKRMAGLRRRERRELTVT